MGQLPKVLGRCARKPEELEVLRDLLEQHVGADLYAAAASLSGNHKRCHPRRHDDVANPRAGCDSLDIHRHRVVVVRAHRRCVDRADILAARNGSRPALIEFEWQADAVTLRDITFAVGDPIENKTTGSGAERVGNQGPFRGLTVADLEETERGYGGIGNACAIGASRTADSSAGASSVEKCRRAALRARASERSTSTR